MTFSIPIEKFIFHEDYFARQSEIHGIGHSLRVMTHVWYIAQYEELNEWLPAGLCAAFIHDMAREHDGFCTAHGKWSAEKVLPRFIPLFRSFNLSEKYIQLIGEAVKNHSLPHELDATNEAFLLTALLKDADALDRVRLGEDNLDVSFLRLGNSKKRTWFARELYVATNNQKIISFTEILEIAEQINQ